MYFEITGRLIQKGDLIARGDNIFIVASEPTRTFVENSNWYLQLKVYNAHIPCLQIRAKIEWNDELFRHELKVLPKPVKRVIKGAVTLLDPAVVMANPDLPNNYKELLQAARNKILND